MDEVLKAKQLMESILSISRNIRRQTSDLNDRLGVLNEKTKEKEQVEEASVCPLYELPSDCLRLVTSLLQPRDLASLGRTCKYLSSAVRDEAVWRTLCERTFGLETNLAQELCSATGRLPHEALEAAGLDPDNYRPWRFDAATGESSPNRLSWRSCYRACHTLQALSLRQLKELRDNRYPREISGTKHRHMLCIALRNLELSLRGPLLDVHAPTALAAGAVQSTVALLHSEHWRLKELASSVCAHLCRYGPARRDMVDRGVARTVVEALSERPLSNPVVIQNEALILSFLLLDETSELEYLTSLATAESLWEYEVSDPFTGQTIQPDLIGMTVCSRRGTVLERKILAAAAITAHASPQGGVSDLGAASSPQARRRPPLERSETATFLTSRDGALSSPTGSSGGLSLNKPLHLRMERRAPLVSTASLSRIPVTSRDEALPSPSTRPSQPQPSNPPYPSPPSAARGAARGSLGADPEASSAGVGPASPLAQAPPHAHTWRLELHDVALEDSDGRRTVLPQGHPRAIRALTVGRTSARFPSAPVVAGNGEPRFYEVFYDVASGEEAFPSSTGPVPMGAAAAAGLSKDGLRSPKCQRSGSNGISRDWAGGNGVGSDPAQPPAFPSPPNGFFFGCQAGENLDAPRYPFRLFLLPKPVAGLS